MLANIGVKTKNYFLSLTALTGAVLILWTGTVCFLAAFIGVVAGMEQTPLENYAVAVAVTALGTVVMLGGAVFTTIASRIRSRGK